MIPGGGGLWSHLADKPRPSAHPEELPGMIPGGGGVRIASKHPGHFPDPFFSHELPHPGGGQPLHLHLLHQELVVGP